MTNMSVCILTGHVCNAIAEMHNIALDRSQCSDNITLAAVPGTQTAPHSAENSTSMRLLHLKGMLARHHMRLVSSAFNGSIAVLASSDSLLDFCNHTLVPYRGKLYSHSLSYQASSTCRWPLRAHTFIPFPFSTILQHAQIFLNKTEI